MLRSYDPRRVVAIFGAARIRGYMPGQAISAEPMTDGSSSVSGMDGDVARALNTDERWTITLNLMMTSPSNTILSAAYHLDKASNGDGVVPFLLEDLNGDTIVSGAQAWIQRLPGVTYSNEIEGRSWQIILNADVVNIGASGIVN